MLTATLFCSTPLTQEPRSQRASFVCTAGARSDACGGSGAEHPSEASGQAPPVWGTWGTSEQWECYVQRYTDHVQQEGP